jgi:hypothetical protein
MNIGSLTVDQLVARFVLVCLNQDQALAGSDVAKFNRLYDEMASIRDELRSRPGDQRRALVTLYDHPVAQVRLQAACETLALAPRAARTVIERIANSKEYPQAGDAGMTLDALDRGIFKPD